MAAALELKSAFWNDDRHLCPFGFVLLFGGGGKKWWKRRVVDEIVRRFIEDWGRGEILTWSTHAYGFV
ncbi:hypothetical protein TNCV_777851 [Trichonephila clavipes]|nr:hypothetical protein TNCV_777851 [Trichonephila clavipes]